MWSNRAEALPVTMLNAPRGASLRQHSLSAPEGVKNSRTSKTLSDSVMLRFAEANPHVTACTPGTWPKPRSQGATSPLTASSQWCLATQDSEKSFAPAVHLDRSPSSLPGGIPTSRSSLGKPLLAGRYLAVHRSDLLSSGRGTDGRHEGARSAEKADSKALLRLRVRNALPPLPVIAHPILPWV
jgi:hypothetical protein